MSYWNKRRKINVSDMMREFLEQEEKGVNSE